MAGARDDFADRIVAFGEAAADAAVQVRPPSETAHNSRARLLRNGLAVVGFATLEDFVKKRVGEVLAGVSGPTLKFSELPIKLQNAATVDAMKALAFQADVRRKAGLDHVGFVQDVATAVASTRLPAFQLTDISFGYARPNLSKDDYKAMLSAFLIKSCWAEVGELAKRVGLGGPTTYDVAFQGAAQMRHRAAHNGAADTAVADLTEFAQAAIALAIGFDALISRCGRLLREKDAGYLAGSTTVLAKDIQVRFVDRDPVGKWRERPEGARRAVRVSNDGEALFAAAVTRGRKARQLVVMRGAGLIPRRWFPADDL